MKPVLMPNSLRRVALAAGVALATVFSHSVVAQQDELQQLVAEIAQLQAEVQQLEAIEAIENLQRIWGFYIDKELWTQAADLFADNGSIELGGDGVYQGRERVLAYLSSKSPVEGPRPGILNDHMQLMPVITVAADGMSAKGRWHLFSQEAESGVSHNLGTGIYENEYVLEDGVWKIARIQLFTSMRTDYDKGWALDAQPRSKPGSELPPDAAPTVAYENYPAVFVPPFHYANPGSGAQPVLAVSTASQQVSDTQSAAAVLDGLQRRITRLADAEAVERLQTVYGYYLARNQWDDLTGIFAEDGAIEIAQRGVYRGKPSVRRNLDLYGVQGELEGQLHNHMQYQPVIHISEDGQTAHLRSRAFSMMGNFGTEGLWMGGTYENIYVKRDGVWQILWDQQFNTYFAPYGVGWKELQRWQPPAVNPANPPDEPPSVYFEMYPRAFLPPFHYANPVTGRVTEWAGPAGPTGPQ
jgi:hypothetical protein